MDTLFTGIVAVALLLQVIAFWAIYRSIRRMSIQFDSLSAELKKSASSVTVHAENLLGTVRGVAEKMRALQDNLTATSAIVQHRAVELDAFLAETSDAARLQIARIQDVVNSASRSVEDTFDSLNRGIIAPIREINALVTGIRVGLDVLLRRRSGPAAPSGRDGEMFI
jgi:hypothetical protein